MSEYTVMIADDDEDMRVLVRRVIELEDDTIDIREAEDGTDAFQQWQKHRPDVLVIDLRMPGADGLTVSERILTVDPDQDIILFSAQLDDEVVSRAESIGVRACVSKERIRDLSELIRQHRGDVV